MSRLLVAGAATSLDRYVWLPSMRLGTINRPREVLARAGGKGLNAARAAAGLGVDVRAVALAGGPTGRIVRELAPPLDVRFADGVAETRQCQCLLDDAGTLTEVYEPVREVPPTAWPAFRDAVAAEIAGVSLLAVCGRVPPGFPVTALADLVDLARAAGVAVFVDSDGPALHEAARRGPDLIKVNDAEAGADGADGLRRLGARAVVVTHGPAGATYTGGDGLVRVTHDPIAGALPVGSGDAFLAGLADARLRGLSTPDALAWAAAAARANARRLPAGDITPDAVRAELPNLRVS